MEQLRDFIWGPWMMALFLAAGLYFTIYSRGFQLRRFSRWWKATAGAFGDGEKKGQVASACTALAATVGTGNIAGVATAIAAGGPGAVFWMWICGAAGMMTAYAEVYLGRKYRYVGEDGKPVCGPFVYLERGLGFKKLGLLYAAFCALASFGMGSMVQANSAAESAMFSFGIPLPVMGLALTVLAMAVIFGGAGRISRVAVRLVPFSAGLYMALCITVIGAFAEEVPGVFAVIFKDAFRGDSAAGGILGFLTGRAVRYGVARGVFSNEAGLGSLAVLHGETGPEVEAEEQGMWAIFEVFFDTIVSCTMTALALLCVAQAMEGTGMDLSASLSGQGGLDGSALMAACFSSCFGSGGGILVSCAMILFAFATMIAWYYLGQQAVAYLTAGCRDRAIYLQIYGFLYLNAVFFGCVARLPLVWGLSDIFNGLMAVPNLIGLWFLRKEVRFPDSPAG